MKKFDFPILFQSIVGVIQPNFKKNPQCFLQLTPTESQKSRKLLKKLTIAYPKRVLFQKESKHQQSDHKLVTLRTQKSTKTTFLPVENSQFTSNSKKEAKINQQDHKQINYLRKQKRHIITTLKRTSQIQVKTLQNLKTNCIQSVDKLKRVQIFDSSIQKINPKNQIASKASIVISKSKRKIDSKVKIISQRKSRTGKGEFQRQITGQTDKNRQKKKRISIQNGYTNIILNQQIYGKKQQYDYNKSQQGSLNEFKRTSRSLFTFKSKTNTFIKQNRSIFKNNRKLRLNKGKSGEQKYLKFNLYSESQNLLLRNVIKTRKIAYFPHQIIVQQLPFISLRQLFEQQQITLQQLKIGQLLQDKIQKLIKKKSKKEKQLQLQIPPTKRVSIKKLTSIKAIDQQSSQIPIFQYLDNDTEFPTIRKLLKKKYGFKKMMTELNKRKHSQQMFDYPSMRNNCQNKQNVFKILNDFRERFQQNHLELQRRKNIRKQSFIFQTDRSLFRKDILMQRKSEFNRQTKMIKFGQKIIIDASNVCQTDLKF